MITSQEDYMQAALANHQRVMAAYNAELYRQQQEQRNNWAELAKMYKLALSMPPEVSDKMLERLAATSEKWIADEQRLAEEQEARSAQNEAQSEAESFHRQVLEALAKVQSSLEH